MRLIASQVSARMALIVLCSTDFFGFATYGSFESTARAFAFEELVLGGKTEIERPSLPP